MKNITNFIKIFLAVILLLCIIDMPYGYYQFVRFASFVGFSILAFISFEAQKQTSMIIYGALALLFLPFFLISLGRELWLMVDIIVGIALIYSVVNRSKKSSPN